MSKKNKIQIDNINRPSRTSDHDFSDINQITNMTDSKIYKQKNNNEELTIEQCE